VGEKEINKIILNKVSGGEREKGKKFLSHPPKLKTPLSFLSFENLFPRLLKCR
jgi:hypothetical protein